MIMTPLQSWAIHWTTQDILWVGIALDYHQSAFWRQRCWGGGVRAPSAAAAAYAIVWWWLSQTPNPCHWHPRKMARSDRTLNFKPKLSAFSYPQPPRRCLKCLGRNWAELTHPKFSRHCCYFHCFEYCSEASIALLWHRRILLYFRLSRKRAIWLKIITVDPFFPGLSHHLKMCKSVRNMYFDSRYISAVSVLHGNCALTWPLRMVCWEAWNPPQHQCIQTDELHRHSATMLKLVPLF